MVEMKKKAKKHSVQQRFNGVAADTGRAKQNFYILN